MKITTRTIKRIILEGPMLQRDRALQYCTDNGYTVTSGTQKQKGHYYRVQAERVVTGITGSYLYKAPEEIKWEKHNSS